jgi:ribosomal 50S subunit-associated protein YjgA (DUF615 family)
MTATTHINTLRKAAKSAQGLTFGLMDAVQGQRQTELNLALNETIAAFIADHPDTDRETIRNALADAAADAGVWA